MQEDPSELLFGQLSRFQRLYARALGNRLAPYGVSPGYLSVLQILWKGDGIIQKDLRFRLGIEQATLSNTLKRMERDGLIERTPDPKDRRHHAITLTEKGNSVQRLVHESIEDLRKAVNNGLTVNDRRYFKRVMRQMTDQLEDDLLEPLFVLVDEVTD
eukprot:TRINITY_DN15032_c0_g2_i1.p4 TRINITY_DN15032_c0_g2~~TRINITY_DN15032_c0_g2_i1.p4  ORF type:complete len:158 (+),score=42.71 TRINITY_DN15032_c0_g2_i1:826-1299(+)